MRSDRIRFSVVALLLFWTLVLSACGSTQPLTSVLTHTTAAPRSTSTQAPPTTTTTALASTIVAISCPTVGGNDAYSVLWLGPTSGTVLRSRTFDIPPGASVASSCPGGGAASTPSGTQALRADFNSDFSELAITFPVSDSGTTDVGYVTAAGQMINETSRLDPSAGSFSQTSIDRSDAAFRPGSDELWWTQSEGTTPTLEYLASSGASPSAGGAIPASCGDGVADQGNPESWWDSICGGVVSSDQKLEWDPGDGSEFYLVPIGQVEYSSDSQGVTAGVLQPEINNPTGCWPIDWPAPLTILCGVGSGTGLTSLGMISLASNHQSGTTSIVVPSVANRSDADPVLSPDDKELAFASCLSSQCNLYVVKTSGGQPQLAGPLNSSEHNGTPTLVQWLN
jgi:hypothetical protein